MSRLLAPLVLLSCAAIAGCYDAHTLDDGEPSRVDAAGLPLDAAVLRDARPPRDVGPIFDTGIVFPDSGRPDTGIVFPDSGPRDSGRPDTGIVLPDSGPRDSGIVILDSGPRDAGPRDSGIVVRDSGPRDSGPRDSGPRDSGPRDSGPRDSGRPDTGPPDSGPPSVALRFATDDVLVVPDRPALSVAPDTTLEMWIRARGPGPVSHKGIDGGQRHHLIELEGTGDAMELVAGWQTVRSVVHVVRVPFGAFLGRWVHVAMVLARGADGASLELRLYVDLELVATALFPNDTGDAFNLEPLRFGRFDGDLDEIRLWTQARDLAALRAAVAMRIRPGTPGLNAYWSIEEAGGQIVLDRALRGNDGILGLSTRADDRDPTWIFDGPVP